MWRKCLMFLLMTFFLVGCGNKNTQVEIDKNAKSINQNIVVEKNENESIKSGIANYGDSIIVLRDLVNDKDLTQVELSPNEFVACFKAVGNGYVAVNYGCDNSAEESSDVSVVSSTSELQTCKYILFNGDLEIEKELSLMDFLTRDEVDIEEISNSIPVISDDGTRIAWALGECIYCLDIQKSKGVKLYSAVENEVFVDQIIFVGNDKIGLMGIEGEAGESTLLGYIEVENDQIVTEVINDYCGFSLFSNGHYLFVNDGEDPKTEQSSGMFYFLNCQDNTLDKVKLNGLESTMALVSEDGTCVIAVKMLNDKSFSINKYEVKSGTVIDETICKADYMIKPIEICKFENDKYGVIYYGEKGASVKDAIINK